MNVKLTPFPELYRKAYDILTREMGVVETLRFFSQLGFGAGNYTNERRELFADLTLEEYRSAVAQLPSTSSPAPTNNPKSDDQVKG